MTTDTLDALIAKLEAATEGSEELDTEIAIYLGWALDPERWVWTSPDGSSRWHCDPPHFRKSRSLDAALSLVPEGWGWGVHLHESGPPYAAYVRSPDGALGGYGGARFDGTAAAPALALVIAALKARRAAGC